MKDAILKDSSAVCWGCGRLLVKSGLGYLSCPPCDAKTVTVSDDGRIQEVVHPEDATTTRVP
jgi:uncharacterized Zn finger protein (UPF0148 family)